MTMKKGTNSSIVGRASQTKTSMSSFASCNNWTSADNSTFILFRSVVIIDVESKLAPTIF